MCDTGVFFCFATNTIFYRMFQEGSSKLTGDSIELDFRNTELLVPLFINNLQAPYYVPIMRDGLVHYAV